MFELKQLSKEAVPKALEKAERYRLLNEPAEAESICSDILRADPGNQQALVMLLLTLTDQFEEELGGTVARAKELLPRLADEYARTYYRGIICERTGKAWLKRGSMGSGGTAYESFLEAMRWYEAAEAVRPPGNDDALLRWNTCARILERHAELAPVAEERTEPQLE